MMMETKRRLRLATKKKTQKSTVRGKRKQKSTAPEQSNAKRTLPTRLGVWTHYTRFEDNYDTYICSYWKKDFSCPTKSGTTNLRNRNESYKAFKAWEDGKNPSQGQKVINKEGQLQSAKVSERVFREATNEMLVIGEFPMSFVESVAFWYFCNKVSILSHYFWSLCMFVIYMFLTYIFSL